MNGANLSVHSIEEHENDDNSGNKKKITVKKIRDGNGADTKWHW